MISRCEEIRPLLTDYALQEGGAAETARIEAHVAECVACRNELAESRAMLGLLERSTVMEDLPHNIRVAARPQAAVESNRNWWAAFWNRAGRLTFAGGALACLAVGLMGIMNARLSYDANGFELAFGGEPAASATVAVGPAVTPASVQVIPTAAASGLSREQVEQLIVAAVRASELRQQSQTDGLIRKASLQADDRRAADLQQMAETFRYMHATQTNLWKEQVQSQQIVATLAQKNGLNLSQ